MFHVIDDDVIIRETMQAMLCDAGYDVLCYESGDKYIQYMNSSEFESPIAVLSDITMPGISGYDLALEIRKRYPFQIIVFVSGNPDNVHNKQSTQETCLILSKPFYPDQLIAMVEDLILPCYGYLTAEKGIRSTCMNAELHRCPFCSHSH